VPRQAEVGPIHATGQATFRAWTTDCRYDKIADGQALDLTANRLNPAKGLMTDDEPLLARGSLAVGRFVDLPICAIDPRLKDAYEDLVGIRFRSRHFKERSAPGFAGANSNSPHGRHDSQALPARPY